MSTAAPIPSSAPLGPTSQSALSSQAFTAATTASSSQQPPNTQPPSSLSGNAPSPSPQLQGPQLARPSSQSRHSSFNFRGERGNWIAAAGLVIATISVPGLFYGIYSFRLSKWSAEKDFWEHCKSLKESEQYLDQACLAIVDKDLPAPPYHSADYFIAIARTVKRAIVPQQYPAVPLSWWDYSRWLATVLSFYFFRHSTSIWKSSAFVRALPLSDYGPSQRLILVRRTPGPMILILFLPRGILRLLSLIPLKITLLAPVFQVLGWLSWILAHALWYTFVLSDRGLGIAVTETGAYWAVVGSYNSFVSDEYTTIVGLILRLGEFWSCFFFVCILRSRWPASLSSESLRLTAKGNECSFFPALCGIFFTWISALLFCRDIVVGCSLMGVQGFWVPWGRKQVPWLQFLQVPLTTLFLIWFVCACIDDYRHGRGVFASSQRGNSRRPDANVEMIVGTRCRREEDVEGCTSTIEHEFPSRAEVWRLVRTREQDRGTSVSLTQTNTSASQISIEVVTQDL